MQPSELQQKQSKKDAGNKAPAIKKEKSAGKKSAKPKEEPMEVKRQHLEYLSKPSLRSLPNRKVPQWVVMRTLVNFYLNLSCALKRWTRMTVTERSSVCCAL